MRGTALAANAGCTRSSREHEDGLGKFDPYSKDPRTVQSSNVVARSGVQFERFSPVSFSRPRGRR
jgi:hypothetical protein